MRENLRKLMDEVKGMMEPTKTFFYLSMTDLPLNAKESKDIYVVLDIEELTDEHQ